MATRSKVPAHLDGARSAKAVEGLVIAIDGLEYGVANGCRYRLDHPVVLKYPDRFRPSGEDPEPTRVRRDFRPRPKVVTAPVEIRHRAVCTGEGCNWEGPLRPTVDAARHDMRQHAHRVDP